MIHKLTGFRAVAIAIARRRTVRHHSVDRDMVMPKAQFVLIFHPRIG